MMKIGIDLGGTKIEGIALSQSGEALLRHRVATPQGDYAATLEAICNLINQLEVELDENGSIGICTPGSLSSTGLMRNSNSVCMNGKAVQIDLQRLLKRDIRIANDANCFALSEAIDGAAKDAKVVFGVIIGTGTGAGIVINKHVLIGANAIAGEWGHNPLPWPEETELPGRQCYCGKKGCIETWLSGPGILADYKSRLGASTSTASKLFDAEALISTAETGDEESNKTLQLYEDRMARSLAFIINILDPEVIVLGGGMGNIKHLYENVPKLWSQYIFSDEVLTQLKAPLHGDSSGVRGAAWLWNS